MSTPTLLHREPSSEFPYRIDQVAGEGAMGIVYRATDVNLARPVAIKVLKTDSEAQLAAGSETRQRFLQEARAAATLTHPGVTTVYQIGHLDELPFIVMEWVEGVTLEDAVQRQGPLQLDRAIAFMTELLEVLEAAHAVGVVHRDIKPSNLMVMGNGRLKVMDFGIAQLQGSDLVQTMAGSVLATPSFASPEQMQGIKVDGRSDLFSTAVVFYHLLTAALPWKRDNLMQFIQALLQEPHEPVRSHRPELPILVESWFSSALERQREKRFADAAAMSQSLLALLPMSQGTGLPGGAARGGGGRGGGSRSSAMSFRETAQQLAETSVLAAPPTTIHVAKDARSPWHMLAELLRSWQEQASGTMDREAFLAKLLEKPIHTAGFAGAALFGNHCLLVEDGVVLSMIDVETGQVVDHGTLQGAAAVRLFFLPASHSEGTMALLAGLLSPGKVHHQDLDSLVVKLPALIAKLQSEGFEGIVALQGSEVAAYLFIVAGKAELALLSSGWAEDPRQSDWSRWLAGQSVKAQVFEASPRPPDFWFHYAYKNRQVVLEEVKELPKHSGKGSSAITLVSAFDALDRLDGRLFRLDTGEPACPQAAICLRDAPAFRILDWMVDILPRLLVERQRAKPWKYLADWLLQIHRAKLHCDLERPGKSISDPFDVVTENDQGKVLHLAQRLEAPSVDTLRQFIDRVIAAKEARRKGGDIGGVLVVSSKFPDDVLDLYRSYLNRGFGNQLLGLDKSMGYEGFVRMSARRGFHLLLVEETPSGLRPLFHY